MKKRLMTATMALMLTTALAATPALAMSYEVDEPEEGMFAPSSSVEEVIVVGGPRSQSNIDRSKNASVAPPSFGCPDSYQPGTGAVLLPQTSSTSSASTSADGTVIGGSTAGISGEIYLPPAGLGGNIPDDMVINSANTNKFTLCDAVGIPCIRIASADHSWNEVYVDGQWLTVDVSSNDISIDQNAYLLTTRLPGIDRCPEATRFAQELLVPGSTK